MSDERIYAPNTCQVPNIIIDYWMHKLSDTQFKVLMVITRKTLGWGKLRDNISSSQIEKLTGFTDRTVRRAVLDLMKLQLITCTCNNEEDGTSAPNTFQLYILENKENIIPRHQRPPHPVTPDGDTPSPVTPTKPKTKPTSLKGNDYGTEKSLPFQSEKEGIHEKTKYPLRKDQMPYFEQMKSLDLGIDDQKIMIKIRDAFKKGKVKQLQNAICHIRAEIEKGTKFKKERIALFTQAYNEKISPISENVIKNKKFAEVNKRKANWVALEIHEKYVICLKCNKELSLDRPQKEFENELSKLFDCSSIYN